MFQSLFAVTVENLELALKLYFVLLAGLDLILIIFAIFFLRRERKNGEEKINELFAEAKEKIKELQPVIVNNVAPSAPAPAQAVNDDTSSGFMVRTSERIKFDDEYPTLSAEQKKYYEQIVKYTTSLPNITLVNKDYERSFKIGKGKILSTVRIKNGALIVKVNMGKLKVGNGIKPLTLKPVKITVKDQEDIENIKVETQTCYLKQTGVINANYDEEAR